MTYKYHWRIDPDAWYLRLYLAMWHADPKRVDICKLFWGYFPPFFVLNLIAHAVLVPIFYVLDWADRRIETYKVMRRAQATPLDEWVDEEPVDVGPSLPERFLMWFGTAMSSLRMRIDGVWTFLTPRWVRKAFVIGLFSLLGVTTVAAVAIGVYFAVNYLNVTAIVIGTVMAIALTCVFYALLYTHGVFHWIGRTIKRLFLGLFNRTAPKTVGFFGMLRLGFYAVKTNTCPKVTVGREETA